MYDVNQVRAESGSSHAKFIQSGREDLVVDCVKHRKSRRMRTDELDEALAALSDSVTGRRACNARQCNNVRKCNKPTKVK